MPTVQRSSKIESQNHKIMNQIHKILIFLTLSISSALNAQTTSAEIIMAKKGGEINCEECVKAGGTCIDTTITVIYRDCDNSGMCKKVLRYKKCVLPGKDLHDKGGSGKGGGKIKIIKPTVEAVTICVGDSLTWEGHHITQSGLYVSPDSTSYLNVVVAQKTHGEKAFAAIENDTLTINGIKVWKDTTWTETHIGANSNGCDSTTTYTAKFAPKTVEVCPGCELRRKQKAALGRFTVGLMISNEEHYEDWTDRFLTTASLEFEHTFKKSIVFRRNPCFFNAVSAQISVGKANQQLTTDDNCVSCHNLGTSDPGKMQLTLQYKVGYLRSWPFLPSIGAGCRIQYQRVDDKDVSNFTIAPLIIPQFEVMVAKWISCHFAYAIALWDRDYISLGLRFHPVALKNKTKKRTAI